MKKPKALVVGGLQIQLDWLAYWFDIVGHVEGDRSPRDFIPQCPSAEVAVIITSSASHSLTSAASKLRIPFIRIPHKKAVAFEIIRTQLARLFPARRSS